MSKICSHCNFKNQDAAKYCQHCGSLLKNSHNIKAFISSLNLGSIAGTGAKGVSVAPLVGMELDKNKKPSSKVTQSHSLEDGSWFCPYCGQKNTQFQSTCSNCLNDRP